MFYCLTPQIPKIFNVKFPRFSIGLLFLRIIAEDSYAECRTNHSFEICRGGRLVIQAQGRLLVVRGVYNLRNSFVCFLKALEVIIIKPFCL